MNTFPGILIANRGEIAVRIIRTAREMGIKTFAIYQGSEKDSLYVRMADAAFELQGNTLAETFLDINQIVNIARKNGMPAIHPGYGFLSENPAFASACENSGITFIGPSSRVLALTGNKVKAREAAARAGIPLVRDYKVAEDLPGNEKIEFPILIKPVDGGGGKGMRVVFSQEELAEAVRSSTREALEYTGNGLIYAEQYIEAPSHIEVQILGDHYGHIIHLFERECSVQRRHQKIIEESPSPSITGELRQEITGAAVRLAQSVGYTNAGTVEFLVDRNGNFFFLEMNSRIQVEHPVTELTTGLDIVKEQILIASGCRLRHSQDKVRPHGHAIECRIYAEDPEEDFRPSPGKMTLYSEPQFEKVRIDSGYGNEAVVEGNYDPLLAKVITSGSDREEARKRMIMALENFAVHGITTNTGFLLGMLHSEDFTAARVSTAWCSENVRCIIEETEKMKASSWLEAAIGGLLLSLDEKAGHGGTMESLGYWRAGRIVLQFCLDEQLNRAEISRCSDYKFALTINGTECSGQYRIDENRIILFTGGETHTIFVSGNPGGQYNLSCRGFHYSFRRVDHLIPKDYTPSGKIQPGVKQREIYSPLPGKVIKVNKTPGDIVQKGEILIIVESMKMENSIASPASGIVSGIGIREGELTDCSMPLLILGPLPVAESAATGSPPADHE